MEKIRSEELNIAGSVDTNFLKVIGIISMTFDHFGKAFFPDIESLQIIGRLAFPLFSYCVMIGCLYTKDLKKYFLRLIIPACIYQLGYFIAGYIAPDAVYDVWLLNIFFTLALGVMAIGSIKQKNFLLFSAVVIIGIFVKVDYGLYGIMLMPLFYVLRERRGLSILIIGLYLIVSPGIQRYAVLSMVLISIKTNFNFKINKYFFYIYYPVHLLVIFLIKTLI